MRVRRNGHAHIVRLQFLLTRKIRQGELALGERESGDLRPADGDAEGGGAGLVEADGVEGNAHPGALDAYDEREREGSEDEGQANIVEEE